MNHSLPGPDEGVHLRRLARRGTATTLGAGVNAAFGVAVVVIITNGFSPELAGTLFAATSAFLIVESAVLLGTDTGLVKWLPTHLATNRRGDVRRALLIALLPVGVLSVTAAATAFFLAPSLAPVMVGAEQAEDMSTVLRVLAVMLPAAAVYDALQAATRGMGTMRPTVAVEHVGRMGTQAVSILLVAVVGAGVLALVLAWSLPYVLALALTAVWMRALLRRRDDARSEPTRAWVVVAREFWWFTGPRALARITQTALKRSDIVLVAALSSPADAALYTAATRFVAFGQVLVQSVQQALAPHLSKLFARGEVGAAESVFRAATVWTMLPAWPLYLVIAGFAPSLMLIFGTGYTSASAVVTILSLTMLFATACGPVDSVLLMAGRSWLSLFNTATALLINLALNVVLIPLYGIRGAAAAWAVAIVVRNVLPLTQVRRHLGLWPATRVTGYVAGGALLCFGIPALSARGADSPFLVSLAMFAAGAAIYVWLVVRWRGPLHLDAFTTAMTRRGGPGQMRTVSGSSAPSSRV